MSVVQSRHEDKVEYYHVELDSHDVIRAEGAWAESFIDDDSRGMFHNAHEYAALYPNEPPALARYYAPRPESGLEIERARAKIAARAGRVIPEHHRLGAMRGQIDHADDRLIRGWAQNPEHPEVPVCLDVIVDGKLVTQILANLYRADLETAGVGSGCHSFEVVLHDALSPDIGHMIEVRRAADGEPLGQSPHILIDSLRAENSSPVKIADYAFS